MGAVCIFFRKFAPETKTIHDMAITEIRPGIHYVGVNDRTTTRFEGLWPLPIGVSYNSYLVVGEQVALIDTVEESFGSRLFENIREVIGDRKIDYLVVNHMEPDHSSSIAALRLRYPDLKIVGNAKTLQMIGGYYGIDAGTLEVKEGDTLDLGAGKLLTFHLIP
ncbi:flavodoxin, partial [human gut metagenome]